MGILRFLLALSVLIVHSEPIAGITMLPGFLAVELFYVISGHVMAMVYCEKYALVPNSYSLFISNRFLRLFPLYGFVVVCVVFFGLLLGAATGSFGKLQYYWNYYHDGKATLGTLGWVLLSNLTLLGQDVITFFGIGTDGTLQFLGLQKDLQLQELLFIPIAWTVSVEFLFYFATPFVVTKSVPKIVLLIFSVLLFRAVLWFFFDVDQGFIIYRFAPTEFFWFLLGVLSYRLHKMGHLLKADHAPYALVPILIVLFTYRFFAYPVLAQVLLYGLLFVGAGSFMQQYGSSKWDKRLGDLCYPMYVSHGLFLLVISANRFPKTCGVVVPLLIFTLLFSMGVNRYLLTPIEVFRKKRVESSADKKVH